jgi:hypothetical protein
VTAQPRCSDLRQQPAGDTAVSTDVRRPRIVLPALHTSGGRREDGMSVPTAPRRSPPTRPSRADQRRGARHGGRGAGRAPTLHSPGPTTPAKHSGGGLATRPIAPLAAVEASAQAAAEAAAGLLLSAAALAADTLAAVLSPTEFAAEVINRATQYDHGRDRDGGSEADPDRLDRPPTSEPLQ